MKTLPKVLFAIAALSVGAPLIADDSSTSGNTNQRNVDVPYDTTITTNVKAAYLKEKLFGDKDVSAFSISVSTKDGIVYLTGTADNQQQADNAVKLAKKVEGVKQVVSEVKLDTDTD